MGILPSSGLAESPHISKRRKNDGFEAEVQEKKMKTADPFKNDQLFSIVY